LGSWDLFIPFTSIDRKGVQDKRAYRYQDAHVLMGLFNVGSAGLRYLSSRLEEIRIEKPRAYQSI
jgi:hypothetical protein